MSDRTHLGQSSVPLASIPLVVDLDGTLTRSDLLMESVLRLLALDPLSLIRLPRWLMEGKAAFKARMAGHVVLDLHMLPLNEELVEFIRAERRGGRKIYLASASDRHVVQALADHVGLFDGVFASDGATNLHGAEKARVLCDRFGDKGFDYVGNSRVDLDVWAKARRAILVNVPGSIHAEAVKVCADTQELSAPQSLPESCRSHLRAIRIHQWLKNVLVFLPALAGHSLDWGTMGAAALAFLAFCLCASSVYVLNDLMDLSSDRAHSTKRARPFASGRLPLVNGLALVPLLLLAAGLVCMALPMAFAASLAAYYVITLLYTFTLKRRIVIDVFTLAGLYTMRVIAGGAATGIVPSEWLLAFSMFLFLSLALIKRYSELVERQRSRKGRLAGRGYVTDDIPIIGALAVASGFVSVLVLALYIHSPDVLRLYPHPEMLWGVGVLLLYWVSRVLMLAHRGEVHDDPLVFAVTDRMSLITVALMGLVAVVGATP